MEKLFGSFFYINPLHTCLVPTKPSSGSTSPHIKDWPLDKLTGYEEAFGHLQACFSLVKSSSKRFAYPLYPADTIIALLMKTNEMLLHTSQQFICGHDSGHSLVDL